VRYDVYLDANDPTPETLVCSDVSRTSCDPGTLKYDTHYYWQVVATDDPGATTTGPLWDFTTVQRLDETGITFDTWPDGTPIVTDTLLEGDEFRAAGIMLRAQPESEYCSHATSVAILLPGTYFATPRHFLTSAAEDDIRSCNGIPVVISFEEPVRDVRLTFSGASIVYTMKVYDNSGRLLKTVDVESTLAGVSFEVGHISESANISFVTFGRETAVTAVEEVYYGR
jgi:hypothetical protein